MHGAVAHPVEELRSAANRFGSPWRERKAELLERCSKLALDEPAVLLAYHDCLLFLLAYPEDQTLYAQAQAELERIAVIAQAPAGAKRSKRRLFGSGIAWSEGSHAFTYPIAKWLCSTYPDGANVDLDALEARPVQHAVRLSLLAIEHDLTEDEFTSAAAFFHAAKGSDGPSNLSWLVDRLEHIHCDERTREQLFDGLHVQVRVRSGGGTLSRTFARGLPRAPFFHADGLNRQVDAARLLSRPLPKPRRLSSREATHLIDAARGVLASLGRETDVISIAAPQGVFCYDLERGFSLALYSMPPERRFVLDSHVGFMLFKNAIPLAYGGGWPFLGTCKIGVNIFEPFRGGESAYAFVQVMRVYAQRFAAQSFLVEPYQLGEGNREGLQSGAFWFYYRLGFRPVTASHARLAAEQHAHIEAQRGYRAPPAVMRRLSRADLELRFGRKSKRSELWPSPALLGSAVTHWVVEKFAGDRAAALAEAQRRVVSALGIKHVARWSASELHALEALSPLFALIPGLSKWSAEDRRALIAAIRAKGAWDESEFARRFTEHKTLRRALQRIAARAT